MSRSGALAAALPVALVAAGCGSGERTVNVLAAASLSDVMTQVEQQLEADEPGLDLQVSYAGSAQIVQQVNEGVDADVMLLAGETPLASLDQEVQVGEPVFFATNTLTIAVAPGDPAGVTGLRDLARDDVILVLCAEQVPCGAAAATMLKQAGVTPQVASYEPDVRSTLAKVTSGEADAGVVYVTDVASATGGVDSVEIPAEANVVNRYPALVIGESAAGRRLVEDLQTPQIQDLLAEAGFGAP